MVARQSEYIRAFLGGGDDEDRIATAHFLIGAVFLAVGGLMELLAIFSLRFSLLPISFGRLEPMANLTLMLGFAGVSLLGGVYYVLPRLTGARLWSVDLARASMILLSGLVAAGWFVIGLGLGGGRQPFGLPWWMHVPFALALILPAVVVIGTITRRREPRSFVTIWFVLGGVVWLPLLYLTYFASEIPGLSRLAISYTDLFFTAGFLTMFVLTVGTGLAYYSVVKEVDVPLASRQLAQIGFWSIGFAGVWWGSAQIIFGPGPTWVAGAAAAFGVAFPVGALANAANVSLTLEGRWGDLAEKPGITSAVLGLYGAVIVAVMASLGSFPTVASIVGLTAYWEAVEYAALLGVGTLLVAGLTIEALPRVSGRRLVGGGRAKTFIRLTVIGVGGVLLTLAAAGMVSGYSWLAGSNSAAYVDVGQGWGMGAAAADTLKLLGVAFAVVAFLGQLAYVSVITGTLFTGQAVSQEILVQNGLHDE